MSNNYPAGVSNSSFERSPLESWIEDNENRLLIEFLDILKEDGEEVAVKDWTRAHRMHYQNYLYKRYEEEREVA